MIEEKEWFSNRNPKPCDADDSGLVVARMPSEMYRVMDSIEPKYVIPERQVSVSDYIANNKLTEWRHTDDWLKNHEEVDRGIDQIAACGDGSLFALAKDGTIWYAECTNHGFRIEWGWEQLPPLPKNTRKTNPT